MLKRPTVCAAQVALPLARQRSAAQALPNTAPLIVLLEWSVTATLGSESRGSLLEWQPRDEGRLTQGDTARLSDARHRPSCSLSFHDGDAQPESLTYPFLPSSGESEKVSKSLVFRIYDGQRFAPNRTDLR